jgi:ABC-type phosphate transport system substrate-binding protein
MLRLHFVFAILIVLAMIGPASAEELLIIANPSVNVALPLTMREIEAIYLLRITTWPDGSHIVPVNREVSSAVRAKFTVEALQENNATLAAYWNEMHFQGKLPPVVQESEPAMLAFVQRVPGAIGYISASTAAEGVKVLSRVP